MSLTLHTPRQVLQEAVKATQNNPDAPATGMQHLRELYQRILDRGLLDIPMKSQSIEDLFEEIADDILKPEIITYQSEPLH